MYRHLDVALRALVRNYDDIPDAFETEAASSVTNCGFWTCGAQIPLRFRSFRRGRERPAGPIVGGLLAVLRILAATDVYAEPILVAGAANRRQ